MIKIKARAVCFTGHRALPAEELPEISRCLENTLITLIEQGYCYFGAGGALDFDTLTAQTVLRLRERYPQVRLILVLPCYEQTRGWPQSNIDTYEDIKRRADKVAYTAETYFRGCMQKRNRHLVHNSNVCVCYLTKSTGGTAYTVNYARRMGLRVINIAETAICEKLPGVFPLADVKFGNIHIAYSAKLWYNPHTGVMSQNRK